MTLYEFLGVAAFIITTIVTLIRVYNIMLPDKQRIYNIYMAFVLFAIISISWLLAFIPFANDPQDLAFHVLFLYNSFLGSLNFLLFIIEYLNYFKDLPFGPIKPYNARESAKENEAD